MIQKGGWFISFLAGDNACQEMRGRLLQINLQRRNGGEGRYHKIMSPKASVQFLKAIIWSHAFLTSLRTAKISSTQKPKSVSPTTLGYNGFEQWYNRPYLYSEKGSKPFFLDQPWPTLSLGNSIPWHLVLTWSYRNWCSALVAVHDFLVYVYRVFDGGPQTVTLACLLRYLLLFRPVLCTFLPDIQRHLRVYWYSNLPR